MKLKITAVFVLIAGVFLYLVFKGGYFSTQAKPVAAAKEKISSAGLLEQISKMDLLDYNSLKISTDFSKIQSSEKVVIHLWAFGAGHVLMRFLSLLNTPKNVKTCDS